MRWTSDKPTEPGWYWKRQIRYKFPRIVMIEVKRFKTSPKSLYIYAAKEISRVVGAEWAGPIPKPEEPS